MIRLTLTCVPLAILACGCGGDEDAAPGGGGGPAKLTVQETAGVPSAFVGFGVEQGILERQDLEIELQAVPADLEGKTLAVNTLENITEVVVKAALEKEGVDVAWDRRWRRATWTRRSASSRS